jgi:hypothetical protein
MASAAGIAQLDADGLATQLDAAQAGRWMDPPAADGPVVALAARALTPGQLPLALFLDAADPNAERWTVLAVLDDAPDVLTSAEHLARWADWLPWANLLQFLGLPESERAGVIAGASQAGDLAWEDLRLRHAASSGHPASVPTSPVPGAAAPAVALTDDQLEELELVVDEGAAQLARQAMEHGAPLFEAGHEVDGEPLEVAWPARHVAVLEAGANAIEGWDARPSERWTLDELLSALEVR